MSKESPGAKNPDPLTGRLVVSGRTNAQKIQAKKKKQRWRNYTKMRKTLSEDSSDVVNLFHDCANNDFKNEAEVDEDGAVLLSSEEMALVHIPLMVGMAAISFLWEEKQKVKVQMTTAEAYLFQAENL